MVVFVHFRARCGWIVTSAFLVDHLLEHFGTEFCVSDGRLWEIGPNKSNLRVVLEPFRI